MTIDAATRHCNEKTIHVCFCGNGKQLPGKLRWVVPVKQHSCIYCKRAAPSIRVDKNWTIEDGLGERVTKNRFFTCSWL